MKIMFVEVVKKIDDFNIDKINFNKLPTKIMLAYSVQYKKLAKILKKKLGKRIVGFKQVLGCSKLKSKYPILLIGSGKFHAIQLALQGNKVYLLEGKKISKLGEKEIKKIKTRRKTAKIKFLAADKIGILVSCKLGQENLKEALKWKKNLEKQGKEVYIFVTDNINITELENYDIQSWLNTACPALTTDSKIVNVNEIEQ